MKEELLLKRLKDGDDKALELLFNTYYKLLCSYAVQFTGRMTEAEDIVQNVFVCLWAKRERLSIEVSIKSYLYRATRNAYIDKCRKERKTEGFLESLRYSALVGQIEEEDSVFLQKVEKMKELIDTLPDRCKEIILLSKREGYKNREIAEILQISLKTVESQLRIAFKKIRKGFKEDKYLIFMIFRAMRSPKLS